MKKILFFSFIAFLLASCTSSSGGYPNLTACLAEKKVVMFGASWCPHCADQKKMFGRSAKNMPYFECSKGNTQVQECTDRGITSYPTWQFNEEAIKALPELAQIDLFNGELDKVRASIKLIREAIPADDTVSRKIIDDFSAETEAMVMSDLTPFEKLTKITSLSIGTDGKSVEKIPAYVMGRITGTRPLDQVALYSGCTEAYKTDTQAVAAQ
jgi:thiol-disulfide isomerase/thioredoxin